MAKRPVAVLVACLTAFAFASAQRQVPEKYKRRESDTAVKVTLNGELVKFQGTHAIMEGSRIFVPLRGVFERMGATVEWRQADKTVVATKEGMVVSLPVGKKQATVDEQTITLDQPAMVVEGRVVVPLRFLAQTLGAKVDWLTAERTVSITTEEGGQDPPFLLLCASR